MTNTPPQTRSAILYMQMSEFWSGDLGLTLVSISLCVLIFVIFPLREAGLPGRFFFDLMMVTLMVSGALVVKQSLIVRIIVIAFVIAGATTLWASRIYPTPFLLQPSFHRHGTSVCAHCVAGDVSPRHCKLEPHPGRHLRLSSSWLGLGFRISTRRTSSSRVIPLRFGAGRH